MMAGKPMSSDMPDLYFANRNERDRQYNARASVADFDACMREYARRSELARQQWPGLFDLVYGPGKAQRLDLFPVLAQHQPAPVFVYIHGGYWRALSKADSCMMVPAFVQAGVAVCTLGYTLLPHTSLFEILHEVRSAIAWLHQNAAAYGMDPGRIVVGGSSAGGHLAAMAAAAGWQSGYGLPDDAVKGMVGLSGLYDIQPLCDTHINDWLRLYPDQARQLSPLYQLPPPGCALVLTVGGQETSGFRNQTAAYHQACLAGGLAAVRVDATHSNHFDLVHELCSASSELMQAVLAAA